MIAFTDKELESIDKFEQEHLDCYRQPDSLSKTIGFTTQQKWTGIGVGLTITCDCCGKTKDITDYDSW